MSKQKIDKEKEMQEYNYTRNDTLDTPISFEKVETFIKPYSQWCPKETRCHAYATCTF